MRNITHSSFVARGVAAALTGVLAPARCAEAALGGGRLKPYTRYNVNTAQGQAMLDKYTAAVESGFEISGTNIIVRSGPDSSEDSIKDAWFALEHASPDNS